MLLIPLLTLSQVGCQKAGENKNSRLMYVGTYTRGESEGIYRCILQPGGSLKKPELAAKTDNPSFLALSKNQRYLLAVNEVDSDGTGMVESYRIGNDSLRLISNRFSGGAHPCFIAVNDAGYVLTANYNGGNVGLLKMGGDGELSDLLHVQQHTGKGTTPRQEKPHAHSARFEPGGNRIVSADLGTNQLWLSRLDTGKKVLLPSDPHKISMSAGAGPRHLEFHPHQPWLYVINELNSTVTLLHKFSKGHYEIQKTYSTLPDGYEGENLCAEIAISPDGRFVYASNRGHNSLAIFQADPENGHLTPVGHQSTRGNWPRNFSLTSGGKYLVVANQRSNNLVSFKRNLETGTLKYRDQTQLGSPVCIVFEKLHKCR
jgi:6-phosphogluconolactonase